jgi:hypothetical protein
LLVSRLPDALEGRDRAVSAVVGFILIFGILVVTFSLYQATVVPQQNSEVEFEQQQDIQQQMVELRSNIVSMQGSASTLSTTVDLGVRYPSRTIFVNPGPASGSLRTEGASNPDVNVTLRNVEATDSDETGDFWNGTKLNYSTSIIEYEPDYNQFQGGLPVVYEHSLVYNRVENGDSVPITDQSLINGNRINLIALNGTLAENGVGSESIDLEPISTRTRVVEVNNKSGPITLEFPSLLNADFWNETLGDKRYIESVSRSGDGPGEFSILTLKLDKNPTYELKLSKVGLGTGATNTTAEYLTEVEGAGATVQESSTQKLTVEARDRFNGPQSGVRVNASAEGGDLSTSSKKTNSEGQATFVYDPDSGSLSNNKINFTIDSEYTLPNSNHNASTRENVTMNVNVTNGGGSGGGGGNAGVGQGGNENYSEADNERTFSVPNGLWKDITCTDQLILSNGQPASRPDGDDLEGDVIRLSASLNNTDTGERYTMDIKLARATDGWNNKEVVIYDGNDNEVDAELTAAAAKRIYEAGKTDILNLSNYDDPDTGQGSFSDFVNRTQDLDDNESVEWQTSRVTGRVNVTLACDSPSISNFMATNPSGQDVKVSFDSDEQLSTISVDLSGPESTTLSEFDETDNGDGTYTYTNTTTGVSDGDYTATLETAEDAAGNNGSTGENDTVTVGGSTAVGDGTLVYQSDSDDLSLIEGNGSEPSTPGQTNLKIIGQPGTGLSSGDTLKIPYVDNSGNLKLTDINGGTTTLVNQNDNAKPRKNKKSTMATGTWNGSNESVFYAGRSNNKNVLYRVSASGTPEEIKDLTNNGITGVVDIGDIDSDAHEEIIYVDSSANLRYIDQDGTPIKFNNGGNLGSNNALGAGEIVEFNGEEQLLFVDGSGNLQLAVSDNINKKSFSVSAKKTQPAAADVDGDGNIEFVYLNGSSNLKYVDNVTKSHKIKDLNNANGKLIDANVKRGVVSANNADSGTGSDLPSGDVAFDDSNGNGEFDSGEETYTEDNLTGGDASSELTRDVNLIIERGISAIDEKIDLDVNSTTIRNGVMLRTTGGNPISIAADYDMDLSGANLTAQGKDGDIKKIVAGKKGAGNINANDTVFIYDRDAVIEAEGGTLYVNNNGGDRADGGTYIEKTDGNAGTIELSKGALVGTPEKGTVDDS